MNFILKFFVPVICVLIKQAMSQDNFDDDVNSQQTTDATVRSPTVAIPNQSGVETNRSQSELYKTLSKSKASIWVDTEKGNIFSSSYGASNLEDRKNPKEKGGGEPAGHSKNMLLTLLIQPDSSEQIKAVDNRQLSLKPILLLLQQQRDLNEILLEKEEKIEKMNVHLQNQINHQQELMVELLGHIRALLDNLNVPKLSSSKLHQLRSKGSHDSPLSSSSVSSANAVVLKQKTPDPHHNPDQSKVRQLEKSVKPLSVDFAKEPSSTKINQFKAKYGLNNKPVHAGSESEVKGNYRKFLEK